jgi:hypothetical protein
LVHKNSNGILGAEGTNPECLAPPTIPRGPPDVRVEPLPHLTLLPYRPQDNPQG